MARLKRLLFGPRSDQRAAAVTKPELALAQEPTTDEGHTRVEQTPSADTSPQPTTSSTPKPKRPGHERLAAAAYTGARVEQCIDPQLKAGTACPDAVCRGRLYDTKTPAVLIRLEGQPIVGATRYEQEVLRCSCCQTRFTAPLPDGVKPEKYDATADVAVVMAKYAGGIPGYRLARLHESCGIPLPESIQFEQCERVADALLPVFLELEKMAARGEVLKASDTRVVIPDCVKENQRRSEKERRGLQTTGIVAQVGDRHIALYYSGRQHAGENIDHVLAHRPPELGPPIQTGDAISANWSRQSQTIAQKCLTHARRKFIEIQESFPQPCQHVMDVIGEVYKNERQTKGMTAAARLLYHQQRSGPLLAQLREWIDEQFTEAGVEPNNALGHAFSYLKRHWHELTTFLRVEHAPLDSNAAERSLKRVVLNRKNSLFYKTEHGAAIGDILASVIETCRLNHVNAGHTW